jgi:puromycin-sensitive aminopeptidase
MLGADPATIELDPDGLLLVNADGASFVRVEYPADHLERLASLETGVLSEVERYALIDDAWASVLAGATSTTTFLNLLEAMAAETSCSVWERMIHALEHLAQLIGGASRTAFAEIAHDIVSPMLANLGLVPVRDEPEGHRRLRADLVKAIGTVAEDPDVQAECQRTVSVGKRDPSLVDPSLMAAALHVTAHVGDEADFNDFVTEFHQNQNPQEQLRYLFALTRFPSEELTARFRQMVLDGDVRSQNAPFALRSALTNPATGPQTWEFMKANWDRLIPSLPSGSIGRMLEGVTTLDTPEMVGDVESFLRAHPVPGVEKIIDQILEKQRVHASLRSREADRLSAFVAG